VESLSYRRAGLSVACAHPTPDGIIPEFGIYILNEHPPVVSWDARWVRWPDFRLPADRGDAQEALYEPWRRAAAERVEVGRGRGRTGTALACLTRQRAGARIGSASASSVVSLLQSIQVVARLRILGRVLLYVQPVVAYWRRDVQQSVADCGRT
jgi:hypothetical protein